MYEKPYADVNWVLDRVLSRIRDVLAEKLVGVYLYGSLTTGDFDLGSSDIDLLAAISSELSDGEVEGLRMMHETFAREHPEWEDRLDVDYLSAAALRTFRTERSPIAIITPGEAFHVAAAGREWLMNWYLVREYGLALFGPPATELIGPITREEFVEGGAGIRGGMGREDKRAGDAEAAGVRDFDDVSGAVHVHTRGTYVEGQGGGVGAGGDAGVGGADREGAGVAREVEGGGSGPWGDVW